MGYFKNRNRKFNVFVANRLSRIHDLTTPAQWRHVPTDLNPADDASRGVKPEALRGQWLTGPAFLTQDESKWPDKRHSECQEAPDETPEAQPECSCGALTDTTRCHRRSAIARPQQHSCGSSTDQPRHSHGTATAHPQQHCRGPPTDQPRRSHGTATAQVRHSHKGIAMEVAV